MTETQTTQTRVADRQVILILSSLLLIFFAMLYVVLSPNLAYQPWDSLDYAYSTEVNGITMMRGNHPLGHVLLFLAFFLSKHLGYAGRALTVFQIANGIFGGLTVALFFAMLVYLLKLSPLRAVGFSAILGASYGFWFFAGTGDIYIIALMLSLFAWACLIYEITLRNDPFPIVAGLFTGLAVLSHQLNVMLIPVGITLILLTPLEKNQARKVKIKQMVAFVASASVAVVLGYFLLGYVATSSFSPLYILGWAQGYFGDPSYGRYLNLEYFSTALFTATQAILVFLSDKTDFIRSGLLALFLFLMLLGLITNKALDGYKQSILKAAALQCLLTWPLIFWWEPQNLKFWLLTLLPWVISLALSFEAVEAKTRTQLSKFSLDQRRAASFVPLFMGILILSINTRYGMLNQHNDQSGDSVAFQQAMEAWLSHSNSDDVLITAGDLVPDLLFWGKRPDTVNLYRSLQVSQVSSDHFYDLRKTIDQALCKHHTVLLTPAASEYIPDDQLSVVNVSREDLRSFFNEYTKQGAFSFWYKDIFDNKQLPVYVIKEAGSC